MNRPERTAPPTAAVPVGFYSMAVLRKPGCDVVLLAVV